MIRWREMVERSHLAGLLRDKRVWTALLCAAGVLALLSVWAVRSYHRAQVRDRLNEFAPFASPALDLFFPRLVADTDSNRNLLQPGVRLRYWTLHAREGGSGVLEVRLTREGQRWFSVVGNQIVATFKAGTREVARVLELNEIFPTRQIRFRYRWTQLQTATDVLGGGVPRLDEEYEGEALFEYENDQWRVMYWTAPGYDEALTSFKSIQPAPE